MDKRVYNLHVCCFRTQALNETQEAQESLRPVREHASQGLQEGRRYDHPRPQDHHEGWSHHGTYGLLEITPLTFCA